jgi:ABC-2 type transport system permease protein
MSSLTRNQIVAFLLTVVFSFIFIIMGQDYILTPFSGFLAQVLNFLSLSSHFNVLSRGLIDLGDVMYFIGFAFFWLFLNVKVLQARYYKG